LLAPLLTLEKFVLVFPAVRVADRDAVELDGAAHEVAVANVPGVVVALAPQRRAGRPADVDRLPLVEDVLLQLLPVVVATLEDLPHEGVEVVLSREARRRGGKQRRDERGGDGCWSAHGHSDAKAAR